MTDQLIEIANLSLESVNHLKQHLAGDEDMSLREYLMMMNGVTQHHNHFIECLNLGEYKDDYIIKTKEI